MRNLISEVRTNRHGLRSVEKGIEIREGVLAAAARRERRLFAVAGLMLTGINVLIAATAIFGNVPG